MAEYGLYGAMVRHSLPLPETIMRQQQQQQQQDQNQRQQSSRSSRTSASSQADNEDQQHNGPDRSSSGGSSSSDRSSGSSSGSCTSDGTLTTNNNHSTTTREPNSDDRQPTTRTSGGQQLDRPEGLASQPEHERDNNDDELASSAAPWLLGMHKKSLEISGRMKAAAAAEAARNSDEPNKTANEAEQAGAGGKKRQLSSIFLRVKDILACKEPAKDEREQANKQQEQADQLQANASHMQRSKCERKLAGQRLHRQHKRRLSKAAAQKLAQMRHQQLIDEQLGAQYQTASGRCERLAGQQANCLARSPLDSGANSHTSLFIADALAAANHAHLACQQPPMVNSVSALPSVSAGSGSVCNVGPNPYFELANHPTSSQSQVLMPAAAAAAAAAGPLLHQLWYPPGPPSAGSQQQQQQDSFGAQFTSMQKQQVLQRQAAGGSIGDHLTAGQQFPPHMAASGASHASLQHLFANAYQTQQQQEQQQQQQQQKQQDIHHSQQQDRASCSRSPTPFDMADYASDSANDDSDADEQRKLLFDCISNAKRTIEQDANNDADDEQQQQQQHINKRVKLEHPTNVAETGADMRRREASADEASRSSTSSPPPHDDERDERAAFEAARRQTDAVAAASAAAAAALAP